jgi:acetyl esterase
MPLDPGAEKLIGLVRDSGRPPIETLPVAEARAAVRAAAPVLGGTVLAMGDVRNLSIRVADAQIKLRLYRPFTITESSIAPALLFFHGGGWVVGDLDTHDALCRQLAHTGACWVVAVDYRRAPENRFPVAVEDAAAAARWVYEHAFEFGIDTAQIGVAGDSAGGNLAAVLAIMARDGSIPGIALQLLLYPVCDLGMTYDSHRRNGEGFLLTQSTMRYFIHSYLRTPGDAADWRASPLRAPSLKGTAPAFVLTAGNDPLCDEGDAYAARLCTEGVPTQHVRLEGQIHGFLTASGIVPEAADAIATIGDFMRRR